MATNVEIEKNGNENNINLIKKFTRKVQESGVLRRARSIRYSERKKSEYVKKKMALKSLARKKEVEKLIKLGKMSENKFAGKK